MEAINLKNKLQKYFGFDTFKGDQEAIIKNVLAGRDTFVLMPTGGGKSLCYQLPALLMDGIAIVISPLIALMKNQVDAIRQAYEDDGIAHFINSSLTRAEIDKVKSDIREGCTKLLYVAPESLNKEENMVFLRSVNISFYAIDEAHCISEWGHDFRPEYRNIRPTINKIAIASVLDALYSKEVKSAVDKLNRNYYALKKQADELTADDPRKQVMQQQMERYRRVADVPLTLRAEVLEAAGRYIHLDERFRKQVIDAVEEAAHKYEMCCNDATDILNGPLPKLSDCDTVIASFDRIRQTHLIALTATATDKVRVDIKKNLGMPDCDEFKSSFNRPNLYYEVRPKVENRVDEDIVKFIRKNPGKSGIIYCLSRKKVEELAEKLCANMIKAKAYHAGMDSAMRSQTQDDFIMERIDIIVATIAFGMCIDKPDVRFVIHYDIPKSLEGYYQETGRAGRDGGEGQCITFYNEKDLSKLEKFMEGKPVAEQDIGKQLLQETAAYATTSMCRRRFLLHYFGEEYTEENCGNCNNCLHPRTSVEAKDELCDALEVINAIKEDFKIDYVLDVILGNDTGKVCDHMHEKLECFGIGSEHSEFFWNAVLRQALVDGYIEKDVDNYGLIKITEKGRLFMDEPHSFMIIEDHDYDYNDEPAVQTHIAALDEQLLSILRRERTSISNKKNIPPYVIFSNEQLDAMATTYPINESELMRIHGVGEGKAKRYGKSFCEIIQRYCEENEIKRFEDERVRDVANKSKSKVGIIQRIDRKIDLEDIAQTENLEFDELLDAIESIVESGTKLNIDYYINEQMDEETIGDIYDYFMNDSKDGDLDTALDELEEFEEDDIRLVRIKFLSEQAN